MDGAALMSVAGPPLLCLSTAREKVIPLRETALPTAIAQRFYSPPLPPDDHPAANSPSAPAVQHPSQSRDRQ